MGITEWNCPTCSYHHRFPGTRCAMCNALRISKQEMRDFVAGKAIGSDEVNEASTSTDNTCSQQNIAAKVNVPSNVQAASVTKPQQQQPAAIENASNDKVVGPTSRIHQKSPNNRSTTTTTTTTTTTVPVVSRLAFQGNTTVRNPYAKLNPYAKGSTSCISASAGPTAPIRPRINQSPSTVHTAFLPSDGRQSGGCASAGTNNNNLRTTNGSSTATNNWSVQNNSRQAPLVPQPNRRTPPALHQNHPQSQQQSGGYETAIRNSVPTVVVATTSGPAQLSQPQPHRTSSVPNPNAHHTSRLEKNPFAMAAQKPVSTSYTPGPVPFQPETISNWIFPTHKDFPPRDYQLAITHSAIVHNTLVSLPTGLGKTLIAAVVLYNYYRWFPTGKVVFLAPTLPLVNQQIKACYAIMGIPAEHTAVLTGKVNVNERTQLWKERRAFFCTPQTVQKDIHSGRCDASLIVCLVLDEAHKATGEYAYTKVVDQTEAAGAKCRILGLSATPGPNIKAIQQVVQALRSSKVEARSEDDPNVKQYIHSRSMEYVLVQQGSAVNTIERLLNDIISPLLDRIRSNGALHRIRGNATVTSYCLIKGREEFLSQRNDNSLDGYFFAAQKFVQIRTDIRQHGIGVARTKLIRMKQDSKGGLLSVILKGNEFHAIWQAMISATSDPDNSQESAQDLKLNNPKLSKLDEILKEHFQRKIACGTSSRAIVFSQWRDSVEEIVAVLTSDTSLIRPRHFVGQGKSSGNKEGSGKRGASMAGMKQKEQQQVIQDFQKGKYNVLVCTCIGEEGLDIGEVDLIINFDSLRSPIRMIQRVGRTGRKRDGRVVCLVSEGAEERTVAASKTAEKTLSRALKNPSNFKMLRSQPMFAREPTLDQRDMSSQKELRLSQVGGHGPPERSRNTSENPDSALTETWRLTEDQEKARAKTMGDINYYVTTARNCINPPFPADLRRLLFRTRSRAYSKFESKEENVGTSRSILLHMEQSFGNVRMAVKSPRIRESRLRRNAASSKPLSRKEVFDALFPLEKMPDLCEDTGKSWRNVYQTKTNNVNGYEPDDESKGNIRNGDWGNTATFPHKIIDSEQCRGREFTNMGVEYGDANSNADRSAPCAINEDNSKCAPDKIPTEILLHRESDDEVIATREFHLSTPPESSASSSNEGSSSDEQYAYRHTVNKLDESIEIETKVTGAFVMNDIQHSTDFSTFNIKETSGATNCSKRTNQINEQRHSTAPSVHQSRVNVSVPNSSNVSMVPKTPSLATGLSAHNEGTQEAIDGKEAKSLGDSPEETQVFCLPTQESSSSEDESTAVSEDHSVGSALSFGVNREMNIKSQCIDLEVSLNMCVKSASHTNTNEVEKELANAAPATTTTEFQTGEIADRGTKPGKINVDENIDKSTDASSDTPKESFTVSIGCLLNGNGKLAFSGSKGKPLSVDDDDYIENVLKPKGRNQVILSPEHSQFEQKPPTCKKVLTAADLSFYSDLEDTPVKGEEPKSVSSSHEFKNNYSTTPTALKIQSTFQRTVVDTLSQETTSDGNDSLQNDIKPRNTKRTIRAVLSQEFSKLKDTQATDNKNCALLDPLSCIDLTDTPLRKGDLERTLLSRDCIILKAQPIALTDATNILVDTPSQNKTYCNDSSEVGSQRVVDDVVCVICFSAHSPNEDPIVFCGGPAGDYSCNLAVHTSCYAINICLDDVDIWRCDPCEGKLRGFIEQSHLPKCSVCSITGGALWNIRTSKNKKAWVHPICKQWLHPVMGMQVACQFCGNKGAVSCCAADSCTSTAHPHCAVNVCPVKERWTLIQIDDSLEGEANHKYRRLQYCTKHTSEARDHLKKGGLSRSATEDVPTCVFLLNNSISTELLNDKPIRKRLQKITRLNINREGSNDIDRKRKATPSRSDREDDVNEKRQRILNRMKERQLGLLRCQFIAHEADVGSDEGIVGDAEEEGDVRRIEEEELSQDSFINNTSQLGYTQDNLDRVGPESYHDVEWQQESIRVHRAVDNEKERRSEFATPIFNRRMQKRKADGEWGSQTTQSAPSSEKGLGNMNFIRSVLEHHRNGGEAEEIEDAYHELEEEGPEDDTLPPPAGNNARCSSPSIVMQYINSESTDEKIDATVSRTSKIQSEKSMPVQVAMMQSSLTEKQRSIIETKRQAALRKRQQHTQTS